MLIKKKKVRKRKKIQKRTQAAKRFDPPDGSTSFVVSSNFVLLAVLTTPRLTIHLLKPKTWPEPLRQVAAALVYEKIVLIWIFKAFGGVRMSGHRPHFWVTECPSDLSLSLKRKLLENFRTYMNTMIRPDTGSVGGKKP